MVVDCIHVHADLNVGAHRSVSLGTGSLRRLHLNMRAKTDIGFQTISLGLLAHIRMGASNTIKSQFLICRELGLDRLCRHWSRAYESIRRICT